jgi:hypothetical protein
MKTKEIKELLQCYYNGDTTVQQEQVLEAYFKSDEIADELKKFSGLFSGLSELADTIPDNAIENEIMEYIRNNDTEQNTRRYRLWPELSGIAASVILVVGGFLLFQQQQQQYNETFDNPEIAYAFAEQTLLYVSSKYNQGLAELSNFDKLHTAAEPLQQGVKQVDEYMEIIERMRTSNTIID